jgi:hypothetical protein
MQGGEGIDEKAGEVDTMKVMNNRGPVLAATNSQRLLD